MQLTVKEMELLCVFHAGTRSATLALLRQAEDEPLERMALVFSLIGKLDSMKSGDVVSLAFDPE